MKKLIKSSPKNSLLSISKSFNKPHLDYGNIVLDWPKTWNELFISKLEWVQYNTALTITRAIKCTSHSTTCRELALESLELTVYVCIIK